MRLPIFWTVSNEQQNVYLVNPHLWLIVPILDIPSVVIILVIILPTLLILQLYYQSYLRKAVCSKCNRCSKWSEERCFASCADGMKHASFQTSSTVCLTKSINEDEHIIHPNTNNDENRNPTENPETLYLEYNAE